MASRTGLDGGGELREAQKAVLVLVELLEFGRNLRHARRLLLRQLAVAVGVGTLEDLFWCDRGGLRGTEQRHRGGEQAGSQGSEPAEMRMRASHGVLRCVEGKTIAARTPRLMKRFFLPLQ